MEQQKGIYAVTVIYSTQVMQVGYVRCGLAHWDFVLRICSSFAAAFFHADPIACSEK